MSRGLLDCQKPVVWVQFQEWRLWRAVAGLEDLLGGDLEEVPLISLVLHRIGG